MPRRSATIPKKKERECYHRNKEVTHKTRSPVEGFVNVHYKCNDCETSWSEPRKGEVDE